MSYTNPGFETAGATPGSATGWTLASSVSTLQFAGYTQGGAVEFATEGFEGGWDSNEDYLFAFGLLDAEFALYTTILVTPKGYEDFSEGWNSNEFFEYGLSTEAAQYNSGPSSNFEGFSEEWANDAYVYAFTGLGDLDPAQYNAANDEQEAFEAEWGDNENYMFEFGILDLDPALYDVALVVFENFENEWTGVEMTTV